MPTVHGVIDPSAIVVAKQHVVVAVAVEIAEPGHMPGLVAGQVRCLGLAVCYRRAVHLEDMPSVPVPQQNVVLAVAVEVRDVGTENRQRG